MGARRTGSCGRLRRARRLPLTNEVDDGGGGKGRTLPVQWKAIYKLGGAILASRTVKSRRSVKRAAESLFPLTTRRQFIAGSYKFAEICYCSISIELHTSLSRVGQEWLRQS